MNNIELSEQVKAQIRARREVECFPIINRGIAWYNTLSKKEQKELDKWYKGYLDAPVTGIIPAKPAWIK